ncbi:hypothetical protein NUSPORA_00014 [Nucleospora cyclopteri]
MHGNKNNLLKHIFYITERDEARLFVTNDGIEYHFTEDPFSKKVSSSQTKSGNRYLEIEIDENGEGNIVEEYENIEEFKTPADFYVPNTPQSQKFYTDFYNKIMDPNAINFDSFAEEIHQKLQYENLPDFNPPFLSRSKIHETLLNKNNKIIKKNSFALQTIPVDGKIPVIPEKGVKEFLIKKHGKEIYERISEFLDENLKNYNIITNTEMNEIMKRSQIKDFKLRLGLIENFYQFSGGPFRKLWIKIGYDPRTNPDNYIYQLIEKRNKKYRFWLKENPELVKEVEKDRKSYLTATFDQKLGFFSKSFLNFEEFFNEKNIKEDDKSTEEDYEIFD